MKTFSTAALAALADGSAIVTGAAAILADEAVLVWGGYGDLTFDGRTFEGVGDRGLAQASQGALGSSAQNVTLTLSGLEPQVLELLDAEEVANAPTIIWRLIFDGSGTTMLDGHIFTRGRLDQLVRSEVIGGSATIQAMIEGAARGLGRRGGRMRTDADQRLIEPDDGSHKAVSYASEKTLYWGGQRPATVGSSLGGTTPIDRIAEPYR